jgi:hypothetical protein
MWRWKGQNVTKLHHLEKIAQVFHSRCVPQQDYHLNQRHILPPQNTTKKGTSRIDALGPLNLSDLERLVFKIATGVGLFGWGRGATGAGQTPDLGAIRAGEAQQASRCLN